MSDISHLSDGDSEKLTTIMVPTKDSRTQEDINATIAKSSDKNISKSNNKNDGSARRQSRSRKSDRLIMDDDSMEHKIIHLSEENHLLKKHLRKQEEKIKLLATKLVRLVGERRNKEKRDEILIEEQKARILELDHQVANLRDKLQVSRQQLVSYTRLIPHHPSGNFRQSSATSVISKSPGVSKSKKSILGVSNSRSSTRPSTTGGILDHEFTSKVEKLLLEAKAENQALEDQLRVTRERLTSTEREIDRSRERVKEVEMGHQEELLRLKGQMDVDNDRHKKKKLLSDNIQLIRLQRESRRTSSWLSTMETQCRSLESSLSSATETISQLESQVSTLQDELREEQQKSLGLQKDFEDSGSQLNKMKELEAQLNGLQEENDILKQTNASLVDKSFSNADKARGGDMDETRHLKYQLIQLESSLKSELKSKADLLGSLSQEKAKSSQFEQTICQLNERVEQQGLELEQFKVTRDNVSKGQQSEYQDRVRGQVEDDEDVKRRREEWEQELCQNQWQLVQVRDELNKTRNLLRTQMTINKEYQREIETLTQKLDKAETFHHNKLTEFMEILEQRAEQMSMLEKTLEAIHLNNNARIEINANKMEDK